MDRVAPFFDSQCRYGMKKLHYSHSMYKSVSGKSGGKWLISTTPTSQKSLNQFWRNVVLKTTGTSLPDAFCFLLRDAYA